MLFYTTHNITLSDRVCLSLTPLFFQTVYFCYFFKEAKEDLYDAYKDHKSRVIIFIHTLKKTSSILSKQNQKK